MVYILKRALIFALPVFVIIAALELYVKTTESAYLLKSRFFKNQHFEVLVLGTSRAQNGINPAFLSLKACNVAMGSQDLKMDLALFKRSIQIGHVPRFVILEMSSHRFRENPKAYWRNGINEYFYDVKLSEGINFSKYLLISSNLRFFRNFFGAEISSRKHVYKYNQFGFDENDYDGVFRQMKYDETKIAAVAEKRLPTSRSGLDSVLLKRVTGYLQEINRICVENKIKLILLAPPVYKTYFDEFRESLLSDRDQIIRQLKSENQQLVWMDFEKSPLFFVRHFKDDDHLNADGARMFTKMLNDTLNFKTPAIN